MKGSLLDTFAFVLGKQSAKSVLNPARDFLTCLIETLYL